MNGRRRGRFRRLGGRLGGRLPVHSEGKQWKLATAFPHHITGTRPTPLKPLHIPKRAQPVQLPSFLKSFSFLFSKKAQSHHHPLNHSSSQKGILPLPNHFSVPDQEGGWTMVVNRKRLRHAPRPRLPLPLPPLSKCFFCHKPNHLARDCPVGDFVCFNFHGKGHISRDCPLASRSSTYPSALELPLETLTIIEELSSYAIFYLSVGHPSIPELREILAYCFNLKDWPHTIARAARTSFMVQFPSDDLMVQALDLKLIDMGSFKGRFLRWREDLILTFLPKPFLTWIRLYRLSYHLWDWDFLQVLLKEVGECVMSSNDVAFHDNFSNCKILIKVRYLSDIPKKIRFRYVSPVDGSLW